MPIADQDSARAQDIALAARARFDSMSRRFGDDRAHGAWFTQRSQRTEGQFLWFSSPVRSVRDRLCDSGLLSACGTGCGVVKNAVVPRTLAPRKPRPGMVSHAAAIHDGPLPVSWRELRLTGTGRHGGSRHAGGTCKNDSAARIAVVVSSLNLASSSTTDVMYGASVRLLNFPSRLARAPLNAACRSATPS